MRKKKQKLFTFLREVTVLLTSHGEIGRFEVEIIVACGGLDMCVGLDGLYPLFPARVGNWLLPSAKVCENP